MPVAWVENAVGRLVKVGYDPATRELVVEGRRFRLLPLGGTAWRLARLDRKGDPEERQGYSLRLAVMAGDYDECECKAAARWGRCSHTAAVRAVVRNGWHIPREAST